MHRCSLPLLLLLTSPLLRADTPPARSGIATPVQPPRTVDAWAADLDRAFAEGRGPAALREVLDAEVLMALAVEGLDLNPTETAAFLQGVRASQEGPRSLSAELGRAVAGGATYRYRRTLVRPEGPRALFRLLTKEGAVNWHELVLRPSGTGYRVVDIEIYATGERLSTSMRQMMGPLLAARNPTLLGAIFGFGPATARAMMESFQAARNDLAAGRPAQALARCRTLPPEMQRNKMIALLCVQAAQGIGEAAYLAEMEAYARLFPDDPSQALMSLDAAFLRKNWPKAHACLDLLERRTGPDAHLARLRCNLYAQAGDAEAALRASRRATAIEPGWPQTWYTRIDQDLVAKDWPDLAACLEHLNTLGLRSEGVHTAEAFAPFRESEAYRTWKARSR